MKDNENTSPVLHRAQRFWLNHFISAALMRPLLAQMWQFGISNYGRFSRSDSTKRRARGKSFFSSLGALGEGLAPRKSTSKTTPPPPPVYSFENLKAFKSSTKHAIICTVDVETVECRQLRRNRRRQNVRNWNRSLRPTNYI